MSGGHRVLQYRASYFSQLTLTVWPVHVRSVKVMAVSSSDVIDLTLSSP